MEPQIIFEDEEILIVGKPSGWITNDASTTGKTPVLQTWIRDNFEFQTTGDKKYRDGIVHRLDKETSGILVVAKTRASFRDLQKQFKERVVSKTYTALVHGKIEPVEGEINVPLGRLPWNRERFGVLPGGREALTSYEVISNFQFPISNEILTLVKCFPKTGRTHQIRIHMKHIGNPIVSDEFYAGRKTARRDRKWCPRLFLNASGISFDHPKTSKKVEFESKLPPDLDEVIKSLTSI